MDLLTQWDPSANVGDWVVANGDLVMDASLRTPVLLSLATDALAPASDAPGGDRRGHWSGDKGSLLWLHRRAKATQETRRRAELAARDALAWMRAAGIAASIDVAGTLAFVDGTARLTLAIGINRRGAGQVVSRVYDTDWQITLAA